MQLFLKQLKAAFKGNDVTGIYRLGRYLGNNYLKRIKITIKQANICYVWLHLITLVTARGNEPSDLEYSVRSYWLNQIERKRERSRAAI